MKLEKKFHENVFYYSNVFEDPQRIINILNELDDNEKTYPIITKWYKWLASNNSEDCFGEKKDLFYRNKDNIDGEEGLLVKYVIETMKESVDNICYTFFKDRGLEGTPNISPLLDMCKYTKGGSLGVHYDCQDGDRSLLYSIVMYFNNDYDGGEISFSIGSEQRKRPSNNINDKDIDFWIKPEPGSAVIFPSTYPYLHQSHPIKSGNKYMSTSFIFVDGYDPFNPDHIEKYRK